MDHDYELAKRLLEAAGEMDKQEPHPDSLLDGKVSLRQSTSGYRAAIDPVLLAAATPAVVDVVGQKLATASRTSPAHRPPPLQWRWAHRRKCPA